ncbi:MAG: M23 family metallopeptidase [Endomicrobiales bacterium]|nr:M23 family metallopeptidase [Endomicrobiales bacterium]
MKFTELIKKELKRSITVMFIPHNNVKPLRISFTLNFFLFIILGWTFITISAGYLYSRHIDYIMVKADNKLMQLKVKFFASEVKKSREMLDQVREKDQRVRNLLEMKSKKAIVEDDGYGRGGPTKEERKDLKLLLSGRIYEMNQQDIRRQATALYEETKQQLSSFSEIFDYVEAQREIYRATPNIWPCTGHVTSTYGFRIHPFYRSSDFHTGIDIANEKNTPIYATADGTVRFCDWQPGYGRLIILDHGHNYRTYYGHLNKSLVRGGEKIRRGQLIGLMGATGTATGSHLHYEVQYRGKATNPARFLKKVPKGSLSLMDQF